MSADLQLASLPLFPLGTVLFPGGSLPLRIFEVRYLDMIGQCRKTGTPFGVVSLIQGSEVRRPSNGEPTGDGFATESFHAVGTLAHIADFAAPQAGLMAIRCVGGQRFRVLRHEKRKHGLWVADVVGLPQDMPVPVPEDQKNAVQALQDLIVSLQQQGMTPEQIPLKPPYQFDDCAWVANRWCELLPLPPQDRQRLMALDNPLLRLELVNDFLEQHGITR